MRSLACEQGPEAAWEQGCVRARQCESKAAVRWRESKAGVRAWLKYKYCIFLQEGIYST